jgi:hypothetical protein
MNNKIYLCISMERNILTIKNTSHHIKNLLGYNRSTLKNAPISVLMPSFYVETHQKMIDKQLYHHN